ncbi:2-oxo-4-hydroxy-4-carboxy-5-ureidoimidazoline decarboxylase [Caulobacter ginsengisoli]|uniref:2-oxo-4-hydroxy-4-carboxy-5-ureidoimidazoline decarboxylase n=1 Tax=Caulobacter ginsengisoli TaxID=400775 RepID=A0ABU0IRT0_9CAUL|nr:2-oxo-4-hydroxy-4-carboxy-5-ureidoimidazoline decarboxylase [Caulobacter ginsengisoli]MDQ0464720.1 2-oxo-4-hydroxy-4-carboxy-5-ureidoimidazoline decarboxylase [Caulobacter ginsengisoli]
MTRAEFLAAYGAVYEASPWVAEAVWPPSGDLAAAMRAAVDSASYEQKLALIRAHPELAGRTAIAGEMAEASKREQSGAGLDRCTPEEFAQFQRLNGAYNARFGFPFIIAVKGLTRADILAAFRARLDNDPQTEFDTALEQIHRIAGFRLADLPEPKA